jgi:hypothetical protein
MSEPNPVTYTPILSLYLPITTIFISLGALAVSIITFVRKQKSDQFRTALDIHDRLEQIANELIEVYFDDLKKKQKSLEYLELWEWFAFLVNNKEITNTTIQKYFKPSLVVEVEKIFNDYPDVANNAEAFQETKKLLSKWKTSK